MVIHVRFRSIWVRLHKKNTNLSSEDDSIGEVIGDGGLFAIGAGNLGGGGGNGGVSVPDSDGGSGGNGGGEGWRGGEGIPLSSGVSGDPAKHL